MRAWVLRAGSSGLDDLQPVERPSPRAGAGEVAIRVRACSLNYRDQAVMTGHYFGGKVTSDLVPLSDGAGEVIAVGEGVTGFAAGDRVAGLFFQNWRDGPPNPHSGPALGAVGGQGMLAEEVVLPARGVVRTAESLSFEEAACLPCAGVTAWHALMEGPRTVGPGREVLIIGTGGVSLLAMQIAKAAGARVIAVSSSDEKLARAKALGVDEGVNYRTTPDWGGAVAALSRCGGVDHVVEVGGVGTLRQSFQAVGFGGEVALIGVLTREGDAGPHALMMKGASLRGIFVGSAAMAERLNAAIDVNGIKPVIGRTFAFGEARAAYEYAMSPALFGKAVIRVG